MKGDGDHLATFVSRRSPLRGYFNPILVIPQLPSSDATMHERPTSTNIVKDRAPTISEYNVDHASTLIAQASSFLRFPEEFLCWVGISRNYLLDKDTYPLFEYEDGEEMDLNAFIRTADPRKSKESLLKMQVAAVVEIRKLLPLAVMKKRVTHGSESTPAASHPPKILRADYGKTGGSAAGGKSPSVLNRLLQDSQLMVRTGVPALLPTILFTSSVTTSFTFGGGRKDPLIPVTGPLCERWSVAPVMTAATTVMAFVSNAATTTATPVDVHKLETSSVGLCEKLETYEGSMKQLEEFQDNLMKPLEARLAEIDADFTRCCMHFQENFHPHLLNAISGRRWLLTHGMKLLMAKCLNSTEYMEALGNSFGRAIEKGMHEGLAAGIEHGQAGRWLSDLKAYNPSAEADFNSAVRDLHGLDFFLLRELFAKKDANKVVIGSQALSVALETCRKRVRKMEINLTERLSFLKDVFVSIDYPLSAEALTILPETSTKPPVTTLITTTLSTMVIRPNSDPFLLVEDYENPDLAGAVPEDVISGPKGEGKVGGSSEGDVDVGDLVLSQLENEARDAVL
ncbi:hypothetical protein Tco_0984575 [Tanacetum coccineum]